MARKQGGGETRSGYFTRIFTDHPEWLELSKNDGIYAQWMKDKGVEMTQNEKATMANIKSTLRAKFGVKTKGKKRKGYKKGKGSSAKAAAAASSNAVAVKTATPRIAKAEAERLERQIDEALTMARRMDVQGIDAIVKPLRRARNNIVLMFDLSD